MTKALIRFDRLESLIKETGKPFTATQNKRGYAHLTERGADIPGTVKSDSAAVKLAQEGKSKRWYVKTAKGK